jgi:dUTP pyrophosphatase
MNKIPPMLVKKVFKDAKLPVRSHPSDSGLDVFAYSCKLLPNNGEPSESVKLFPGKRVLVDTGLQVTVGTGFEIQVRPRSGLAAKSGITVLNTPGTIDEGFRSSVGVIIINHSSDLFEINKGDKIAQLVVCPVILSDVVEVDELPASDRGAGGFGSTGSK